MDSLATAMQALASAFDLIFHPMQLAYLVSGVVLGMAVGIFPGLGGIAGLSLVLPFIYGMDPVSGLAMMVGLISVIPTSDTFSSVLLGIPGSAASQATVLDGFPLARQGQAARALSAAFAASLFGGLFGAAVLSVFVLVARPIVLAFGLPEMLMMTALGLSMVAVLAGRVPLKGLASAALGILVGTIGAAGAGGSARMSSFDYPYLYDGLKLVIVGLGIFAVPEIVSLLRQGKSIAQDAKLGAGWSVGLRDWWLNRWLSLRCAVIGVIVGIIPGLGGSVVDWIAYGHTVQSAKDKSRFGSGDIRGVVGPESSNNAKEGGALIPTLLFGIPGSGSMAIFIGGMALLGYEAGPRMITEDLNITYTMVWSLALANVVGAGLCIFLAPWIARLTTVRFVLLAPFLFMMISFAAFQSGQELADLVALLCLGLLGVFLRRFEWSRPAFLIGFVLSNQVEVYTNQAFQIASHRFDDSLGAGMSYLFTPIVLVLIIITVVSVYLGIKQAKSIMSEGQVTTGAKRAPVIFSLLLLAYGLVSFVDAWRISRVTDMVVPAFFAVILVVCTLIMLVQMRLRPETDLLFADGEYNPEVKDHANLWASLGWLVALVVLSAIFGFFIALVLFFSVFFHFRAKISRAYNLVLTLCGLAFMLSMVHLLNRDFPAGLLQDMIKLPWPFN